MLNALIVLKTRGQFDKYLNYQLKNIRDNLNTITFKIEIANRQLEDRVYQRNCFEKEIFYTTSCVKNYQRIVGLLQAFDMVEPTGMGKKSLTLTMTNWNTILFI